MHSIQMRQNLLPPIYASVIFLRDFGHVGALSAKGKRNDQNNDDRRHQSSQTF